MRRVMVRDDRSHQWEGLPPALPHNPRGWRRVAGSSRGSLAHTCSTDGDISVRHKAELQGTMEIDASLQLHSTCADLVATEASTVVSLIGEQ
jgi:hypothetical protein